MITLSKQDLHFFPNKGDKLEVDNTTIDADAVQTVNVHELYEFFEVKRDFSNSIKNQIERTRLM